jgi:hypothetical protein
MMSRGSHFMNEAAARNGNGGNSPFMLCKPMQAHRLLVGIATGYRLED